MIKSFQKLFNHKKTKMSSGYVDRAKLKEIQKEAPASNYEMYEVRNEQVAKPSGSKKEKKVLIIPKRQEEPMTYKTIIEEKPTKKVVCDFIKMKIDQMLVDSDSDEEY
jgi:hypothetical protein